MVPSHQALKEASPRNGVLRQSPISSGISGELSRLETLQRAIMAASLDPMVTIDSYGIMESVSDSVERVFGWSSEEFIGKNIEIPMPEPHHSRHDGYFEKNRETRESSLI